VPVKGTHVLWGTESYGHTASSGDGEITTPFADGAPVVVIGDSHTEALSILDYAIFITFFPRLEAGPIMRGQQFLPQLEPGITLTADDFTWVAQIFNLLLTMLLGGLWHGASWNFVLWGGLHGSYLMIERILRGEGMASPVSWTTVRAWLKATWIFVLVSVTWVFFRSPSLEATRVVWEKLLFLGQRGLVVCARGAGNSRGGLPVSPRGVAIPHRGHLEPVAAYGAAARGVSCVLLRGPG
jgi:hypothetical protein